MVAALKTYHQESQFVALNRAVTEVLRKKCPVGIKLSYTTGRALVILQTIQKDPQWIIPRKELRWLVSPLTVRYLKKDVEKMRRKNLGDFANALQNLAIQIEKVSEWIKVEPDLLHEMTKMDRLVARGYSMAETIEERRKAGAQRYGNVAR